MEPSEDPGTSAVRLLLMQWDAIGIADEPACAHEYDCMISPLLGLLRTGADAAAVEAWISRMRSDHLGLSPNAGQDRSLAEALLQWVGPQTAAGRVDAS